MPANLPPQYFEIEKKYREAETVKEKLKYLKEMLAIMPKHKGTEKLQAQIKRKISQLNKELEVEKSKRTKARDFYNVPKEGAAQVVLVGPSNCGKSSLLAALTSARPQIAEYPFTTTRPNVGMIEFEDIQFQCVDTPPLCEYHKPGWLIGICRNSDILLFIIDISEESKIEEAIRTKEILEEAGIGLNKKENIEIFDSVSKTTIFIANKVDKVEDKVLIDIAKEYLGIEEIIPVSALKGDNVELLKKLIFFKAGKIRVYTKKPGHKPDMTDPLILKKGSTVMDAANKLRKSSAKNLKYAKLYNNEKKGIMIERDYILKDKDIVEFHF